MCGRVEGGVWRSRRRREGHQDILKPRVTEDDQSGLFIVLYLGILCAHDSALYRSSVRR